MELVGMWEIALIFTLAVVNPVRSTELGQICEAKHLFSTKTPYKLVENKDTHITYPEGCTPIQINMVFRHGSRYPSAKDVLKMDKMASKINQAGRAVPPAPLELPWKNPFSVNLDKTLTNIGEEELFSLAGRIRKRFPELFSVKYSPLTYSFPSSCKLRATHSAMAFALGLFEGQGSLGNSKAQAVAIETLPCTSDAVLRFFDLCEKYIVDILENKVRHKEVDEFYLEDQMQNVIAKVQNKLHLDEKLSKNDIKALYIACAYEITLLNGSLESGLCSLFDEHDLHVMEYAMDLQNYYKRSSAYKITYESSCPLLRDILHSLQAAAGMNGSHPAYSGIFRASHAETLIPFYALLGVNVDEKQLLSENFNEMKVRKFRAGCLAPFAGNVYFVLYKCSGSYKLQLYVNERLVQIPACKEGSNCDFSVFEQYYSNIVQHCDLGKMCQLLKDEL